MLPRLSVRPRKTPQPQISLLSGSVHSLPVSQINTSDSHGYSWNVSRPFIVGVPLLKSHHSLWFIFHKQKNDLSLALLNNNNMLGKIFWICLHWKNSPLSCFVQQCSFYTINQSSIILTKSAPQKHIMLL